MFEPGRREYSISVDVLQDSKPETDESFYVELYNPEPEGTKRDIFVAKLKTSCKFFKTYTSNEIAIPQTLFIVVIFILFCRRCGGLLHSKSYSDYNGKR